MEDDRLLTTTEEQTALDVADITPPPPPYPSQLGPDDEMDTDVYLERFAVR